MVGTAQTSSRDRLIEAARELFYLQGYEATSVAEILEKADVNSGSLYYYFSGKEELLLAVLERYGELLWPVVIEPAFARETDPIERIFAILAGYRQGLLYTVFTGGCPIGNLALEVGDHQPEARKRIADNFSRWCRWIERCLEEAGRHLPAGLDRKSLAQFVLTVMEGAVMQARAHGSIAPFDASVAQLRAHFELLQARAASTPEPSATESQPKGRNP
jgi:AcrR family transcriptional regulator